MNFRKLKEISGHAAGIYSLDFDGNYIYSAGADKFVARWHKATGTQDQFAIRCTQTPFSICVFEKQQQLAIGLADGSLHIIDTASKKELKFLKVHHVAVFAIATNEQQKQHYTADADGHIMVWDYQWNFSMWRNARFSLSPGLSLTGNIGFDELATHTKVPHNNRDKMPIDSNRIVVPSDFEAKLNAKADKICASINMGINKSIPARIRIRFKRHLDKRRKID